MFGLGAAGIAAAGAGAIAAHSLLQEPPVAHASSASDPVPFYGGHQAGIVTPAQDRLHFAAFDVTTDEKAELVDLLQEWTAAAARLTQGREAGTFGAVGGSAEAAPDDTGEALGLPASGLTLTIGFGPSLFDDRFGLAGRRPRPWRTCRSSPATSSSRRSRAVTSACRRAPTTRRWPCTPSATWPGSASAGSRCAGRSSASAVPPPPPAPRPPRATSWASRTAPTT
nr:hypothetical protein GCM10020093_054250 [Planobispora longispora]